MSCIQADATDLATCRTTRSNSTIEHVGSHVGSWRSMEAMAGEVRRLAPACCVQTPNCWPPREIQARTIGLHRMPRAWRAGLLMRRTSGRYPRSRTMGEAVRHVEDARCLTRAGVRCLFPGAAVLGERFCGLAKSWMALRAPRAG